MTTEMNAERNIAKRSGFALLAVLMIVMVITIMSLGFLSRSDVELACGRNMEVRTQMDYLAESGLEHARGLILNPQDIDTEYWTGETLQQLVAGSSDYYDLTVARDDTVPNDFCNYIIDSNSYRLEGGVKTSRSELRATLRLDPCIAFWSKSDATLWSGVEINGDVCSEGKLVNYGTINGDVFANALTGTGKVSGRNSTTGQLSLTWPRITVSDFTANYGEQSISSGTLSGQTFGPYNPNQVCYRNGNLTLAGNVRIGTMLIVQGDLVVQGNGNTITAAKNMPALLVTGDLKIEQNTVFRVTGLVVVNGGLRISADSANIAILGGLYVGEGIIQTATDATGNNTGVLFNDPVFHPKGGHINGALEFNGDNTSVEIGTNAFTPKQGTISLWASASGFDGSYNHYMFGHTSTGSWTDRIQLYACYGTNQLCLGLGDSHSRHTNIQYMNINTWYHIALTWDGTNYIVYVNGTERATGSYTGLSKLSTIADIGNTGCPAYRIEAWDGLIDDVRIYDQVLDANDVYPPSDGLPGLVGHWKLDEGGSNITVTAAPSRTAIFTWSESGVREKWNQAAGAFYKSIERK